MLLSEHLLPGRSTLYYRVEFFVIKVTNILSPQLLRFKKSVLKLKVEMVSKFSFNFMVFGLKKVLDYKYLTSF